MFIFPLLPLPRGHYDAQVQDSWIASWDSYLTRGPKRYRALCANVELYKNGKLVCGMLISFFIHNFGRLQRRDREALQSLASAVGVDQLEDSEQLHGKPFRLTVWDGRNMRFSFRPVP